MGILFRRTTKLSRRISENKIMNTETTAAANEVGDQRIVRPRTVLTSYPNSESRHPTEGYVMCVKCGDKRQMKNVPQGYECRKCKQLWKLPA